MDVRVGIVTGSRVSKQFDGDEPGRILQVMVTDAADVQNVQTCQAGDEYNPPEGSTVVIVASGSANKLAVACDDGIAPIMAKGGKRIYATDATGADVVAEVRCHPDGKIEIIGPVATQTLFPDGKVMVDNGEVTQTLFPDGKLVTENGAANFTMNADGTFVFHGVGSTFDHPVEIQGNVSIQGNATATGTVTGDTDVVTGAISLKTHKHGGVFVGANQTGVPA